MKNWIKATVAGMILLTITTPVLAMSGRSNQKQRINEQCAELSQKKNEHYEYIEGKLLQKRFWRTQDIPDAPLPENPETEKAWFSTLFLTKKEVQIRVNLRGTTLQLQSMKPALTINQYYAFCARYDRGLQQHVIDDLTTFKLSRD